MEWKPIGTAPHDGREVLVFGNGSYAVACWNGEEWRDMGDIGWAGMYGDDGNQPTHWRQLPEPPKVGVGKTADVPETDFGDIPQTVDLAGTTHNALAQADAACGVSPGAMGSAANYGGQND